MMEIPKHKDNLTSPIQTHFTIGNCVLVKDEIISEIRLNSGGTFSLTHPESAILRLLIQHQGEVVSKHDLVIAGWIRPDIIGVNSLPVAITNIRKVLKLADVDIINIPRVGYKLEVNCTHLNNPSEPVAQIPISKSTSSHSAFASLCRFKGNLCLPMSIFTILFVIWVIVFTSMSWVTITCHKFQEATFCYNTKENNKPWPLSEGEASQPGQHYFYSHDTWVPTKSTSNE